MPPPIYTPPWAPSVTVRLPADGAEHAAEHVSSTWSRQRALPGQATARNFRGADKGFGHHAPARWAEGAVDQFDAGARQEALGSRRGRTRARRIAASATSSSLAGEKRDVAAFAVAAPIQLSSRSGSGPRRPGRCRRPSRPSGAPATRRAAADLHACRTPASGAANAPVRRNHLRPAASRSRDFAGAPPRSRIAQWWFVMRIWSPIDRIGDRHGRMADATLPCRLHLPASAR